MHQSAKAWGLDPLVFPGGPSNDWFPCQKLEILEARLPILGKRIRLTKSENLRKIRPKSKREIIVTMMSLVVKSISKETTPTASSPWQVLPHRTPTIQLSAPSSNSSVQSSGHQRIGLLSQVPAMTSGFKWYLFKYLPCVCFFSRGIDPEI